MKYNLAIASYLKALEIVNSHVSMEEIRGVWYRNLIAFDPSRNFSSLNRKNVLVAV